MEMMLSFFIFLFGLAIGSFLNVVICRLQTGEGVVTTRSHCPHCQKTLKWFDLIPLVSFTLTLGRCRYCQKKISWQYPLVELATGMLFIIFSLQSLGLLYTSYFLIITSALIVIFVFDLKHLIIPDQVVYPAIGFVLLVSLFRSLVSASLNLWLYGLLITLAISGFFFLLVALSQGRWMGLGDVKLAFLMGLLLGWPNILAALLIAFTSGALVGLFLVLLRKKTFKSQLPFGPFLSAATILILLYGDRLVNWYLYLIT